MENKHVISVWEPNDRGDPAWTEIYSGENFLTALFYFMSSKKEQPSLSRHPLVRWDWRGNYED